MKQYFKYLIAFTLYVAATSCSIEELQAPIFVNGSDKVTVVGRVTNFTDYNVATKGTKDEAEGYIDKVTMAIFPVSNDGNSLAGKCVYYTPNQTSTTFTFDRSKFVTDARYAIFVFANVDMPTFDDNEGYKNLTLDHLLNISHNVGGVGIPDGGFPMIGSLGDTFSENEDRDDKIFIMRPGLVNGQEPAPSVDGESMSLLQIPMEALYAKINFTIEVKALQTVQGNTPQFVLNSYTIGNVSKNVSFNSAANQYNKVSTEFNVISEPFVGKQPSEGNIAEDAGSKINFTFYVPERLVAPATSSGDYKYPFVKDGETVNLGGTIREEDEPQMQRFKPRLLDINGDKTNQIPATNVVLNGRYRDHQNHYFDVSYTIYLGEDNYSNFEIVRNGEYNNVITIKGLTTSSDAAGDGETVAIDHRVNVTRSQPAIIELRREVLLDSHFEVRPLRIRKSGINDEGVNAITHVQVEITDADWMSLERSFGDGSLDNHTSKNSKGDCIYIDDIKSPSYGKRKYFTHNLITGVNAGDYDYPLTGPISKKVVVPLRDVEECVWIYVDECTERGDGIRSGTVKITYGSLNGDKFTPTSNTEYPPVNYVINQRKLFHVVNGDYEYDIEYHEEYLYNYDANDSFGQTEFEGMPWGLDDAQLSFDKIAVVFDSGESSSWIEWIIKALTDYITNSQVQNVAPYYDFYIDKYDSKIMPTAANRSNRAGYEFCQQIINDINLDSDERKTNYDGDINVLDMATQPTSAIEYCYNKNKRNEKGEVVWQNGNNWNTENLKWYLPAIDEIEDIVMSEYGNGEKTYSRFGEFQDKYYWSCQPAYSSNSAHYWNDDWDLDRLGNIYMDFTKHARATKVNYDDADPVVATSGATGFENVVFFEGESTPVIYNLREEIGDNQSFTYTYINTHWIGRDDTKQRTLNRSDLMQTDEGHQPRTKYNRVRCVRYSEQNQNNQ